MRLRHFLSLVLALVLPWAGHAATFSVTNTADSGAGSLRQALIDANADVTTPRVIRFDPPFPSGGVITLQSALPAWSNGALRIDGNGRSPVIDGGNSFRILAMATGTSNLEVVNLGFRRGRSTAGVGGCLWLTSSTSNTSLYLDDTHFENCRAISNQDNAYGGAIAWSSSGSWVYIRNSTFSGNGAGVIGNSSRKEMFGGAALINAGSIEIENSHFSDNAVERVGGLVQGVAGALYASASTSVQLINVEFNSNRVIDASANGLLSAGGAAALLCRENNCTISVNKASFIDNSISGSDIGGGALVSQGGSLSLLNVSFSGNRASGGAGGALFALPPGELSARHLSFKDNDASLGAHLAMSEMIVSQWRWSLLGPTAAGSGPACNIQNSLLQGGFSANLFESPCGALSDTGGTIGPVGPLTLDDSIFPATLVPGAGSPAIDPALPQLHCLPFDALGASRPQDGDGDGTALCDVGAYEVQGPQVFANGFEP